MGRARSRSGTHRKKALKFATAAIVLMRIAFQTKKVRFVLVGWSEVKKILHKCLGSGVVLA